MSEYTLREYLGRIFERHVADDYGPGSETFMDVIGALICLDGAERFGEYTDPRSIEPEVAIRNLPTNGMRLVFDPPIPAVIPG